MAIPTPVNGQITDAVTQSNLTAIGSLPGLAAGQLATAFAHATALMMENAVAGQQPMNTIAQAAASRAVSAILGPQGS